MSLNWRGGKNLGGTFYQKFSYKAVQEENLRNQSWSGKMIMLRPNCLHYPSWTHNTNNHILSKVTIELQLNWHLLQYNFQGEPRACSSTDIDQYEENQGSIPPPSIIKLSKNKINKGSRGRGWSWVQDLLGVCNLPIKKYIYIYIYHILSKVQT